MIRRREFLASGLLLTGLFRASAVRSAEPYRIGLTPVLLEDQVSFLKSWRAYLEQRLGAPVEFIQRASYQEITDLLLRSHLDLAWLCGYPYVLNADRLSLLAIPLYAGRPLYRSYILTWDEDSAARALTDLEGRIFAFSDPLSNSGYLFPQYVLSVLQFRPEQFFRRTFFTWSHRRVIEAVAAGLAEAGAVDGYVWDMLSRQRPDITARTRIVERSPYFGFPPLVTGTQLPPARREKLSELFLTMHEDPEGLDLLEELGLTGFTLGERSDYDDILLMAEELRRV
jgi:phosphonate transport system substrate-binding protein